MEPRDLLARISLPRWLTRAVMDASQGWQVEELHTEEGRLDEVFRSITWSEIGKKEDKA